MNIFTVENEKDFLMIKDAWDSLYFSNKNLTVFQSWNFNFIWWKIFAKIEDIKLKIICFGDKRQLKVVFPCFLDNKKNLKFLQDGYVDFLDLVYNNEDNKLFNSIKKIVDLIKKDSEVKKVLFTNIKHNSPVANFFPYYFKKSSFLLFQTNQYSYLNREKFDNKNFYTNLTSKQRNELKKIDKTIFTEFCFLEKEKSAFPEEEINRLLKNLIHHNNREIKIFKKLIMFLKELYNNNLINLICHKKDGSTVSLSAVVDLNDKEKLIWIDFYDLSIKKINLKNYIDLLKTIKSTYHLNLGTGNHDYKIKNFSPEIVTLYTFYFNKSKVEFTYRMFKKIIARVLNYF